MKKNLVSARDVLRSDLESDAEFRQTWDRTTFARAVAIAVVGYRADHGLSQRKLAAILEWPPSQVARLELGEHHPTLDTLIHLSQRLSLHFTLAIEPAGHRHTSVRPRKSDVVHTGEADGSRLLVAVGA